MSFYGAGFIFNGVPSEAFDLMMYDVGGNSDDESEFASGVEIIEETVARRWKPYFYGAKFENKLEFEITFGVNQKRIDEGRYLDRYELAEVASWLSGYDEYKELVIDQSDMEQFHYKCMISDLEVISYGVVPWALRATVICDGPYAYMPLIEYAFEVGGAPADVTIYNGSSLNMPYFPIVIYSPNGGASLEIANDTDGGRTFTLTDIPASVSEITIDNDHCIITNDQGLNLYEGCNYKFIRLMRGYNALRITGDGTVTFRCEFPINTGG